MVLNLFANVHMLLILNVLFHYLGAAIDNYSYLRMKLLSYLRRLWSLKTIDACPMFILSSVLLEDKQKFKHGGI